MTQRTGARTTATQLGHLARQLVVALLLFTSMSANAAAPQPSDKQQVLWERLRAAVGDIEQQLDGVLGVAILDLTTGQQLLVHPDEVFPQASSIKIAVLAELYRQAEQSAAGSTGKAKLTDRYVVQASDLVPDSNIMGGLTAGVTALTNRDLATIMVAVSDNSATNVLIDRVGMDNVHSLMQRLGLQHTELRRKMMDLKAAAEGRENISTPREMMRLLEQLYRGKVIGQPLLEDFFTVLATPKESWLPRNLPEGQRIANKPGALEGVRNDSGIVFLKNRPYVICVMTTYLASERDGEDAITHISAATYSLFDRLSRASDLGRVVSPSNGSGRAPAAAH
jgi:beta-lactamase class A